MSDTATSVNKPIGQSIKDFASKYTILLVLLGMVLIIGLVRPSFLGFENLENILRISSVRAIIALGVGRAWMGPTERGTVTSVVVSRKARSDRATSARGRGPVVCTGTWPEPSPIRLLRTQTGSDRDSCPG